MLQGERSTWDKWATIRKVNPLMATFPESRAKLLEERDEGRQDSRLRARFLSYRLNVPSADESIVLLTVDDWERQAQRETPPDDGQPIVGVDLGSGRAWSAAVAVWRSGRVEALASGPGIPSLATQEKRDRVPAQTYSKLVAEGRLSVSEGLRVQPPSDLWAAVVSHWGHPVKVVADRFRVPELMDAIQGESVLEPRITRWSESSADIRALRKLISDGPLVVEERSRGLLSASLAVATVPGTTTRGTSDYRNDHRTHQARDDVAQALVLAAGAWQRASLQPEGPNDPRRASMSGVNRLDWRRWAAARREALDRDGWRCTKCG